MSTRRASKARQKTESARSWLRRCSCFSPKRRIRLSLFDEPAILRTWRPRLHGAGDNCLRGDLDSGSSEGDAQRRGLLGPGRVACGSPGSVRPGLALAFGRPMLGASTRGSRVRGTAFRIDLPTVAGSSGDSSPQFTTDGIGNLVGVWHSAEIVGGRVSVDMDILFLARTGPDLDGN